MNTSHTNFRFEFPILVFACAALAVLCLLPGLYGGFVLDDAENIVNNPALHIASLSFDNIFYAAYSFQPGHGSRTLSMLSFALDYWRGGLEPSAFRSTNLAIHAVTTVAVAVFLRRLLLVANLPARHAAATAIVVTAFWAMHPLQVSSVLYIVQRMQILVTLFTVLGMWAYVRMRQAQIDGQRSRQFAVLVVLFLVLGFAGKEDAVLFPAYALALELTILRFQAADSRLAFMLRRGYLLFTVLGLAAYLFVLLPNNWHTESYPARNFSSSERLLTQGRVLLMYIKQSLIPLPATMPFYYDDIEVSRGWLRPPTTLAAWVLLASLIAAAWKWRESKPIFSFGVMLFFAGHFLTSNVFNLELAFEHRNHLPLLGFILAMSQVVLLGWARLRLSPLTDVTVIALLLISMCALTVKRAYDWGDEVRFARATLLAAPHSERAWITMASIYVDRSKFQRGPDLSQAIAISEKGTRAVQDPTLLLSNILIYKTIRGDVTTEDWSKFLDRIRLAPMSAQNRKIVWTFMLNSNGRIPMDEHGVLETIDISSKRYPFTANQNLQAGAYIFNKTDYPERALPYLLRAVEISKPDDPEILGMLKQLADIGQVAWVKTLDEARRNREVNAK